MPPKHARVLCKKNVLSFWGLTAQRGWARLILVCFHDLTLLVRLAGWQRRLDAHFCFRVPPAVLALDSSFGGREKHVFWSGLVLVDQIRDARVNQSMVSRSKPGTCFELLGSYTSYGAFKTSQSWFCLGRVPPLLCTNGKQHVLQYAH